MCTRMRRIEEICARVYMHEPSIIACDVWTALSTESFILILASLYVFPSLSLPLSHRSVPPLWTGILVHDNGKGVFTDNEIFKNRLAGPVKMRAACTAWGWVVRGLQSPCESICIGHTRYKDAFAYGRNRGSGKWPPKNPAQQNLWP